MLDKNMLIKRHEEELNDARAYKEMAENCPEWEQVLLDISEEEEQHAAMISHIIQRI